MDGGNLLVTAISTVLALLMWLLSVIVLAKLTNLPGAVIILLPGLGCGLLLFLGSAVTKVRQRLAVRHRKSLS
jgi:hypothetical protein